MPKILGFFLDIGGDKKSSWDVFIAIDEGNHLSCYCPQTQHAYLDRGYMESCEEITKEEYLEASRNFYTPEDYLK